MLALLYFGVSLLVNKPSDLRERQPDSLGTLTFRALHRHIQKLKLSSDAAQKQRSSS